MNRIQTETNKENPKSKYNHEKTCKKSQEKKKKQHCICERHGSQDTIKIYLSI